MTANILITGGTGFFGRSLIKYLIQNNFNLKYRVTILSRDPDKFISLYPEFSNISWLNFYKGDILNNLKNVNFKSKFTHIIHAAADSTLGPKLDAFVRYDQIVTGTKNILEFAVNNRVCKVLFISSGGAYGEQPLNFDSIPEDYMGIPDPLEVNSVYGFSKRAAEHLCCLYGSRFNLDYSISRCFSFVGPDLPSDAHFAIGNFIHDALYRNKIVVKGDGSALRSYMYQEDLAEWLLEILFRGDSGESFNIGSDQSISIIDLATLVRDLISPKKEIKVMGIEKKDEVSRNRYIPNINKAKNKLNLKIKFSLSDAIMLTAEAYMREKGSN